MIAARDALGLKTRVVGVVAEEAPAYALSFKTGHAIEAPVTTMADGVACRKPDAAALPLILAGAADVVAVSEAEIRDAMRSLFTDTHNVAEGAAGVALAGLLRERERFAGDKAAFVFCGGNIDRDVFARVLSSDV
jgi:threonine dehydratase